MPKKTSEFKVLVEIKLPIGLTEMSKEIKRTIKQLKKDGYNTDLQPVTIDGCTSMFVAGVKQV